MASSVLIAIFILFKQHLITELSYWPWLPAAELKFRWWLLDELQLSIVHWQSSRFGLNHAWQDFDLTSLLDCLLRCKKLTLAAASECLVRQPNLQEGDCHTGVGTPGNEPCCGDRSIFEWLGSNGLLPWGAKSVWYSKR